MFFFYKKLLFINEQCSSKKNKSTFREIRDHFAQSLCLGWSGATSILFPPQQETRPRLLGG